MDPPELPLPDSSPRRTLAGLGECVGAGPPLPVLTLRAFQLRSQYHHALHPIEAALQYHRADAEILGEKGYGSGGFEQAEAYYRTGAQGLRLPEIPQLPQKLRELSRLGPVDRAGRKALREWAEGCGYAKRRATHFYHRLRGSMSVCLRWGLCVGVAAFVRAFGGKPAYDAAIHSLTDVLYQSA